MGSRQLGKRGARNGQGKSPKHDVERLVIPFEDNRLLADLFGEFDCHLALIEDRLGVEAVAHGNVVTVSGSEAASLAAREVLEGLYARLGRGESVGLAEVDGAIRHSQSALGRKGEDTRGGHDGHLESKPAEKTSNQKPSGAAMRQIRTRKRTVTARSPMQSAYIDALDRHDLVFASGPAGTGKTYLAVAYAAQHLEAGACERLILSRPAVEAGERLGFLPGDMRDKVDPYLRPLYDALYDVLAPEKVERGLETGIIEIAPLAFMRGRTLSDAFIILDEAQNATSMQMKMFLTRLGAHSKMVVTGDATQVDLAPGETSGLIDAAQRGHGVVARHRRGGDDRLFT